MNRRACTTDGHSATSGDTSSPSGAPPAAPPPSSGPPVVPPAGHGTGTPSTTATGSSPSPPPSAERPPVAGRPHPRWKRLRFPQAPWIGVATLRNLLPAASPDLSSSAVARWPAYIFAVCPLCGAFEASGAAPHPSPCGLCAAAPPPFDAARSLFAYAGDVRAAIVATKYAGRPYPVDAVALRLRETLTGRWRDLIPVTDPPTVVPVPVHPWKYFRRGFNLPAMIASCLSRHIGFPFDPLALSRIRERIPQVRLSGILRRENVAGAFRAGRGCKVPPS